MRGMSTMDASSMMMSPASSGFDSLRLNPPSGDELPGPYSSRRCMVLASAPVVSVILLAALPVGAASSTFCPVLPAMAMMPFIIVVFPFRDLPL